MMQSVYRQHVKTAWIMVKKTAETEKKEGENTMKRTIETARNTAKKYTATPEERKAAKERRDAVIIAALDKYAAISRSDLNAALLDLGMARNYTYGRHFGNSYSQFIATMTCIIKGYSCNAWMLVGTAIKDKSVKVHKGAKSIPLPSYYVAVNNADIAAKLGHKTWVSLYQYRAACEALGKSTLTTANGDELHTKWNNYFNLDDLTLGCPSEQEKEVVDVEYFISRANKYLANYQNKGHKVNEDGSIEAEYTETPSLPMIEAPKEAAKVEEPERASLPAPKPEPKKEPEDPKVMRVNYENGEATLNVDAIIDLPLNDYKKAVSMITSDVSYENREKNLGKLRTKMQEMLTLDEKCDEEKRAAKMKRRIAVIGMVEGKTTTEKKTNKKAAKAAKEVMASAKKHCGMVKGGHTPDGKTFITDSYVIATVDDDIQFVKPMNETVMSSMIERLPKDGKIVNVPDIEKYAKAPKGSTYVYITETGQMFDCKKLSQAINLADSKTMHIYNKPMIYVEGNNQAVVLGYRTPSYYNLIPNSIGMMNEDGTASSYQTIEALS